MRDSSEVEVQLNRSLAEACSTLQQLQQQCWINHRWEIQIKVEFNRETQMAEEFRSLLNKTEMRVLVNWDINWPQQAGGL